MNDTNTTAAQPLDLDKFSAAVNGLPTYDPERDMPGIMELRDTYNDGDYVKVEDVRALIAQARAAQPESATGTTGASVPTWQERIAHHPDRTAAEFVDEAKDAEIADLRAQLAHKQEGVRRWSSKLEAVWEGIREAVQKYTGKPCEGEPFDCLHELLAQLAAKGQGGMHAAADFIDKRAEEYARENTSAEHDTGATIWHYGDAGRDYHSTLVELAEDLRNAASASAQPDRGAALGDERALFNEARQRIAEQVYAMRLPDVESEDQALFLLWKDGQSKAAAASPASQPVAPALTVWYGQMPESNGKSNFTAILNRADAEGLDKFGGFTIARSEYPDRVRYEADCVRYLIGELAERPCILDYDDEKHSGYVAPSAVAPSDAKGKADAANAGDLFHGWEYCPECGSLETEDPQEGCGYFCANCGQEWHGDIDYSEVVRKNLERLTSAQSPATSAADAKDAWIDVKDRLPEPWDGRLFSKSVLIVDMDSRYPHVRMSELNFEEYEGKVVPTVWSGADPTHWQPTPALPAAMAAAPSSEKGGDACGS